ncbi:hypothetical protein [Kitasatospora acidiphila]|uniref:hypothetical protein n=1 Tax=Kitasatospora acidiphila TaxID=2567942 RepID=UPI003C72115B
MRQRRIAFVIFDGSRPLDLADPHGLFQYAAEYRGGYACQMMTTSARRLPPSVGPHPVRMARQPHRVWALNPANAVRESAEVAVLLWMRVG